MTRQEITDAITEELGAYQGAYPGTGLDDSPGSLQRHITAATDELARLAKGVYLTYHMDLVAGQAVYCASPLLKIVNAVVYVPPSVPGGGFLRGLVFVTARGLTAQTRARTSPESGVPYLYTSEGTNRIELYPVPGFGTTGDPAAKTGYGLTVEGYGVPGGTWDAMTAFCPLPENQHEAVVIGACVRRCEQFPKALGDRLPGYRDRWRWYKGHVESQVASQTSADRRRMREYGGGAGGGAPDPLDNGGALSGSGGGSDVVDGGFLG